jgi:hypothetical protein
MNKLYLPSALALLAGGTWLFMQRAELSAVRHQQGLVRKQLAAARPAEPISTRSSAPPPSRVRNQLTAGNAVSPSGKLTGQTTNQLVELSLSMDRQQLVAALEELPALGLPAAADKTAESVLLVALAKIDPQWVLDHVGKDTGPDDSGWRNGMRSRAFDSLVKKDRAAAAGWLEQRIAAGDFDSKRLDGNNDARIKLERPLLKAMISADPAAAGQRVAAMSEFDARGTLVRLVEDVTPQTEAAFVEISRKHLTDADHLETLARLAGSKAGNLAEVSACLKRIAVTPVEKDACVASAARMKMSGMEDGNHVTREGVDDLRRWIAAETPERLDALTGTLLVESTLSQSGLDYAEAAEMVLHYHEATGSDDLLCAFLDVHTKRFEAGPARKVASKIADPARRAERLNKLK